MKNIVNKLYENKDFDTFNDRLKMKLLTLEYIDHICENFEDYGDCFTTMPNLIVRVEAHVKSNFNDNLIKDDDDLNINNFLEDFKTKKRLVLNKYTLNNTFLIDFLNNIDIILNKNHARQ